MVCTARLLVAVTVWSRWLWLALVVVVLCGGQPGVRMLLASLAFAVWTRRAGRLAGMDFGHLLGSARLATAEDVAAAGQVGPGGLFLGTMPLTPRESRGLLWSAPRWLDHEVLSWFLTPRRKRCVPVGLHGLVNVAVFAPTGVGKSTGFITRGCSRTCPVRPSFWTSPANCTGRPPASGSGWGTVFGCSTRTG